MQRQGSFSQAEYAGKKKQARLDKFLAEMEQAVPWARRRAAAAVLPEGRTRAAADWAGTGCCGSTSCSMGTGWPAAFAGAG